MVQREALVRVQPQRLRPAPVSVVHRRRPRVRVRISEAPRRHKRAPLVDGRVRARVHHRQHVLVAHAEGVHPHAAVVVRHRHRHVVGAVAPVRVGDAEGRHHRAEILHRAAITPIHGRCVRVRPRIAERHVPTHRRPRRERDIGARVHRRRHVRDVGDELVEAVIPFVVGDRHAHRVVAVVGVGVGDVEGPIRRHGEALRSTAVAPIHRRCVGVLGPGIDQPEGPAQ